MALRQLAWDGSPKWAKPALTLPAALLAGFFLAGCAATAELDPQFTAPAEGDRIPMSVGVYYSPELRTYEVKTTPRTPGAEVTLPVGQASVSLLQRVLPSVFESVTEVGSRPAPSDQLARLDTIIEPQIEAFAFRSHRVGKWKFWTEIRYRLTVRAPDGGETASWTVRGAGTGADGPPVWSQLTIPEQAVEAALETAAEALVASFEEVPEAARWRRGQPMDPATAPGTGQITQFRPDSGDYHLRGMYERIVAVSTDPNRSPDPSSEGIDADPRSAGAFSFLLVVENLGEQRLLFRRPEITLSFPEGATVDSVSGAYLAATLTARRTRMGHINPPPGSGIAGLAVVLLTALQNYSAYESETAEATVFGFLYESDELNDAFLNPQERVEGYVHFFVPPNLRAVEEATLNVPVVELDTATRYIVSLPLGPLDRYANQEVTD